MNDPKGLLSTVLTHHVVEGQLAPEGLAGSHETPLRDMMVQTATATVHVVDEVLLPAAT